MNQENFLSFLVSRNMVTPEQINEIKEYKQSPDYFLLAALFLNIITKHQYDKLSSVKFPRKNADKIGEYFVNKKIITQNQLKEINKVQAGDFHLLEKVLVKKAILDEDTLDTEIKEFRESPDCIEDSEDLEPLEIFLSWADGDFRNNLSDDLATTGHTVSVFNDLLEVSCEFDENPCDLVVIEVGPHFEEVLNMLTVLLELNKNLYAAAFSEDTSEFNIPAKLHVEKKFIFAEKEEFGDKLKQFANEIALKKTRRLGILSPGGKKAASPKKGTPSFEIKELLKAVQVDYSKDGVMLFIDPVAVPRDPDRYKTGNKTKNVFKKFADGVVEHLKKLKLEQLDLSAVEVAVWYPWREPVKIAPRQEPTRDATAVTYMSDGGDSVLIDYEPPTGKGIHVPVNEILRKIKSVSTDFFILDNSIYNITSANDQVKGLPVAERRDAQAEIQVSPDETRATLTLRKPYGGKPVSEKAVYTTLKEMNITKGLKRDLIKEFCYSGTWNREVTIAEGIRPVDGKDGKVMFLTYGASSESSTQENHVNHREVKRMEKVSAGEQIIKVLPPVPGKPGVSVRNEKIEPSQGKEVKFSFSSKSNTDADVILGNNVELVLGGTAVISQIDGMLRRSGRTIGVEPVYEVRGDVDYSVGNIDVKGDVIIHGSVLSKFEVRASGNIHILGSVEDAIVESGGSVFIEQGIYGHEKAIIFAQNSVEARCIEQANVFCKGKVVAHTNISHSNVTAFISVETTNPESYIVGGTLRAGRLINTFRLGSPAGTYTMLDVGSTISLNTEMQNLRSYMLKKIAIMEKPSRQEETEDNEAQKIVEDKEEDTSKDRYNGMVIKSYNRYFIDWLDDFVKKSKRKTMEYRPGDDMRNFKIVVENRTFPGVWLKMKGFGFNIKNELAGKRSFSLTGSGISERV